MGLASGSPIERAWLQGKYKVLSATITVARAVVLLTDTASDESRSLDTSLFCAPIFLYLG
jgi:hypothetical protein